MSIAFFFSDHFLELSISFTSLNFLIRLLAIFVVFFSVYISFSSSSYFRSKISQFWFNVVLYISFSSFEAFSSFKVSIFCSGGLQTHLFFIFSFFLRFSFVFPMKILFYIIFSSLRGSFQKFSLDYRVFVFRGCVEDEFYNVVFTCDFREEGSKGDVV